MTLKTIREQKNIKQLTVATTSGISQGRLSLIERGWYLPTRKEAARLLETYEELGLEEAKKIMIEMMKKSTQLS